MTQYNTVKLKSSASQLNRSATISNKNYNQFNSEKVIKHDWS